MQGLEDAIAILVRSAEMLCSLGYTTMGTFVTNTIEEPDRNGNPRRRVKAVVRLQKAPTFDKAYQDYEASRKDGETRSWFFID